MFNTVWNDLYATLVARHNIRGISAFSGFAFAQQLSIQGCLHFEPFMRTQRLACCCGMFKRKVRYYHWGAYDSQGYELRASFALFWFALEYFAAAGLRWLDLGAGAGVGSHGTDGLTQFKRGWATAVRPAYFLWPNFRPPKVFRNHRGKGALWNRLFSCVSKR